MIQLFQVVSDFLDALSSVLDSRFLSACVSQVFPLLQES